MSKNTLLSDNQATKSKLSLKTLAKTGLSILGFVIATTASAETYQVLYHITEKGDSLTSLAKTFKTTPAEIKRLNPSIKNDTLYLGERLVIPRNKIRPHAKKTTKAKAKTTSKVKSNIPTKKYRIRFGDTLTGIAVKNHITLSNLLKLNGIEKDHKLLAGTFLRVPTVKKAKAKRAVSKVKVTTTKKPVAKAKPYKPSSLKINKAGQVIYTVERGDTFQRIAEKMKMSASKLQKLNNIDDVNNLRVGQAIIVRGKTKALKTVRSTPLPAKKPTLSKKISFSPKAKATPVKAQATPQVKLPTPPQVKAKRKYITYTVQNGDTLAGVAKYFGVDEGNLQKLNNLTSSDIVKVGSILKIAEKK